MYAVPYATQYRKIFYWYTTFSGSVASLDTYSFLMKKIFSQSRL